MGQRESQISLRLLNLVFPEQEKKPVLLLNTFYITEIISQFYIH